MREITANKFRATLKSCADQSITNHEPLRVTRKRGKDFVIIDFEGEPARPVSERRIKRSPLRDVAGMLRSFHYAAYAALTALEKRGIIQPEELPLLESWANYWYIWVCAAFMKTYLATAADGNFLPAARQEIEILLDALLLEKAVYELGYELNNRPDWVKIPIQGIWQLMAGRVSE